MILALWVPGEPIPQPRPRVTVRGGFAQAYVPAKHPVHAWRTAIRRAVIDSRAGKGSGSPVREALSVRLGLYLPRPKSHHRASGALTGQAPRMPVGPKFDADNLAKAVLDELTDCGVWEDDGQVCDLIVSKRYADERPCGAMIEVVALTESYPAHANSDPQSVA